jgi:nitrile hydratase subunit beta
MNGIHDLGGMHGIGPVVVEADEPVFHAAWEARVAGMMLALGGTGHYNADTFRGQRETVPAHRYLASRYYELWLYAVEQLIADLVSSDELEATVEQLRRGERTVPQVLDPTMAQRVRQGLRDGHSTAGQAPQPHRYAVGQAVRARMIHPDGHTRLPRYVRGRVGVIESLYPAFPLPDRNGRGGDPTPENLYCVRFTGEELWGPDSEPNAEVLIDLWECYLEDPATAGSAPHTTTEAAA